MSASESVSEAVKHVFTMNSTTESSGPKDWKSKREIAAHFKCSVRTITSLTRRRILPYVKNGRLLRFDAVDCEQNPLQPCNLQRERWLRGLDLFPDTGVFWVIYPIFQRLIC